jgi:Domain of unknown function (DUF6431)
LLIVIAVAEPIEVFVAARGRVPAALVRPARCPACGHGWVTFAGWRPRQTRRGRVDVHRVRCAGCKQTHSLWPDVLVGRRVDVAGLIGRGLELAAGGLGHRRVAGRLGVPEATVRGWLRRARRLAGVLAGRLLARAAAADPGVRAPPAVEGLGLLVAAVGLAGGAVGRLAGEPVDAWRDAVGAVGGWLLGSSRG